MVHEDLIDAQLNSRVLDLIDDLQYAINDLAKKPNVNKAERVKALSYSISVLYPHITREEERDDGDKTKRLPARGNRKNK